MKLKKIAFFSLSLLVILISGLSGCGSGPSSGGLEKVSGISLKLNWPENYTFDPASSQLTYNSSPSMMAAPSYVTGCRVTISGSGMDSITLDVPLSTGQVSGSVTPGERRFDVIVDTQYGVTFSGSTTTTLVSGANATISVNLSVNGVPLIDGISVSNSSPRKRESVSLTVSISDLDITDTHTFEWNGGGGRISGSGPTVAWFADRAGVYNVTVTADDGHGGVASGNAVIGVTNTPPSIISVTADKTSAVIGDIVKVACSAVDADGDSLTYTWSDGMGWTATGPVAQYTVTSSLVSALKCVVEDGDLNGWASGSVGITATSGSPTGVSAAGEAQQIKVTWSAVVGAVSYNIYWSLSPGVTTTTGTKITGATSPHSITGLADATTYYCVVTAVGGGGGESAPSAEVNATTYQPVTVTVPAP